MQWIILLKVECKLGVENESPDVFAFYKAGWFIWKVEFAHAGLYFLHISFIYTAALFEAK